MQLRIGQLVINAAARHRATIVQQKTGKPVQFELTEQTRGSLIAWLTIVEAGCRTSCFPAEWMWTTTSARANMRVWWVIWVESIGLGRSAYGTHRLRRTKVALIYKRTGNLRAVQILLGPPHGIREPKSVLPLPRRRWMRTKVATAMAGSVSLVLASGDRAQR